MSPRSGHAVQRLPITKARINLGQLARRAHVNKEYFILELRDRKVARAIRQSNADVKAGRIRSADALVDQSKAKGKKTPSRNWSRSFGTAMVAIIFFKLGVIA